MRLEWNSLARIVLLVWAGVAAAAEPHATRPWDVVEIPLQAAGDLPNPYVDGLPDGGPPLVRVTFTSGRSRYTVAGFWDGGRDWKVRFAAPAPGDWNWRSESRDAGLNAASGTVRCTAWSEAEKQENPARRGFVQVARNGPRRGRYFAYADGTPFLWIGDTWWNWAKREIRFESFRKLADDRAAKGFTVGQLFFWGEGFLQEESSKPDLEWIRRVERMIAYANSKGITVWIHPWWGGEGLYKNVGAEKARRWWRYVIHRLGAYNVIWVLGGEYNMNGYGGFGLGFWKELGAMVRREDPYGRIIGTHPTPPLWKGGADAPQWSTGEVLHSERWLDYNQSQVGHGRARNEMIPLVVAADYARRPAKPVVVTEPWYEFVRGNPPAKDIRFGAWSAMLSGAAGHSYGGGHVWWAHVPEAPSHQKPWPLEGFEVNTLDYPGALGMAFMAKFLKSIAWWTLEPHPELVHDYAGSYCGAVPGKEYVVYLRWGGGLRLDLRPSRESDQFRLTWFDLTDGQERKSGSVGGGATREFQAPESYPAHPRHKDWLLHVRR